MIQKYFIISLIVYCQLTFGYSLVFVHIGQQLPAYLSESVKQARLFNEQCTIYLIANKNAVEKEKNTWLADKTIKIVLCEDLKKSTFHEQFLKSSALAKGFWRNTMERFFYLQELIKNYNLKHIFHLENDVMLYRNLAELLPVFYKYRSIAAVFDNDKRCIPSFLYIRNARAISKLVEFISQNATSGKTDMETIAAFKQKYASKAIKNLPIVMPHYLKSYQLSSANGEIVTNTSQYHTFFKQFNSIFDGAAIGQYLGGIDPIHKKNGPGFINESCIFNPSHFQYEWKADEKGRNCPYIKFKKHLFRINNLHIHSKRLELFSS